MAARRYPSGRRIFKSCKAVCTGLASSGHPWKLRLGENLII